MAERLRIAIDIDGVLADSIASWTHLYNRLYSRDLEKEHIAIWNFWRGLGLRRQEFQQLFTAAWMDWKNVPCMEENLPEKLETLRRHGELDIVTGRTPDTVKYVKRWLKYQKLPYREFYTIPPDSSKADSGHDVYLDDSPMVASEVAAKGRLVLLYDQPWNRGTPENPRTIRVKSFDDAALFLTKLFPGAGVK